MKFLHRRTMIALAAAAFSVAAVSTGSVSHAQAADAESVVQTIKKRGVIKVGMSSFVPWAMRDKKGELIGFEIDVAKKVAEDMGVEVEFVPTAWDGIIPALLSGKFDVIIGGMSITPQRNLSVNFTRPYARSGVGFAANKKLADGMTTLDAYNASGVKLAVRRGITAATLAQKIFPKARLLQFDDDAQAFQEVVNGNAHAVLSSEPKPTFWTIENSDVLYQPFDKVLQRGAEAMALRKGDPDALNYFSNWVEVRTNDGWLAERHDYWFKTQNWKDEVGK
ncbi:transporter substrate-binding domain-containing protein [Pelagibius sp. Alg239-R121]|uniref:transporter substrate-binding domain-containing protein n=1 Tax=Pelagibius sp. Alg239-R121 TaxID=2993448 RepID=UPI0024A635E4|nr:transporter substrate-binding domain-containing protein [Pelagibius sp. Alg239-R121]